MKLITSLFLVLIAVCSAFVGSSTVVGDDEFFIETVAPIFQRTCFECHNDDERKGDFSLQNVESAMTDGYIQAGDADNSHLFDLISVVDGEAEMPKDAEVLTADEIAAIRKWIKDGAKWPDDFELNTPEVTSLDWWSLKPLSRPTVPDVPRVPGPAIVRTPIDAFVQDKLREKRLTPAPEADKRTLIRRVYFDLIGLPPSPEEVDTFVNDDKPDAYEKLVDRLLASDHYGERWARHWLDVAHYADTHGYDKDKPRPNAWPYRDYVIRSLNDDKPYTRFVMEQLAGDALYPHTLDGVTATGFISAGPWDFIGHAEVPESKIDGQIARNLDRDDMVTSTMNTFCSVTVQCARCHNHKFDPVTQEHYYSLQAVFSALDRADTRFDADALVAGKRADLQRRKQKLLETKDKLQKIAEEKVGTKLTDLDARIDRYDQSMNSVPNLRPEYGFHSRIEKKDDVQKWVQIDLGQETSISRVSFIGCYDNFNGIGKGFGFPPRFKIEACLDPAFESNITLLLDRTEEDHANPGTTVQHANAPKDHKARYIRFTATKLAPRQNDYIFALAELQANNDSGQNVALHKPVTSLDSIEAPVRWQKANLVDGVFYEPHDSKQTLTTVDDLRFRREELIDSVLSEKQRLTRNKTLAALDETESQIANLPPQSVVYAATIHHGSGNFAGTGADGGKPREIHVLHRGDVLSQREPVGPGAIPIIEKVDWRFDLIKSHHESERRIALARWIVRRDNPLTWRSIVNRVWHYHFGRGIVDSPNDFGRMGATPSHPVLLDWLAVEFRDTGGSLKKLHKLILTSSVYRQSSKHDPDNATIDSGNSFLWRMNRRRLSAEETRDAVLAVSGKLDRTMFGPPFQEFVIERPEHSPHYQYDKHDPDDTKTHRRSIYRFTVRSQPDPFMTTLDCADSSQSVAKRDETTTALQALSMLNNDFMLRMSEHFAIRLERESKDADKQVRRAYWLIANRDPAQDELQKLVAFRNEFGTASLCRLLYNLNEFAFVD